MRQLLSAIIVIGSVGVSAGKDVQIHGFVTAVRSNTSFEIENYKIVAGSDFAYGIHTAHNDPTRPLKPVKVYVGLELYAKGDYDERTSVLTAKQIQLASDTFQKTKGVGPVGSPLVLERSGSGWKGTVEADGEQIRIVPETAVLVRLNKRERKQTSAASGGQVDMVSPLSSPENISLGTFASYEGDRQVDNSIVAAKVEFEPLVIGHGEARTWEHETPVVSVSGISGLRVVTIDHKDYTLCRNDSVQAYLTRVGDSLIPEYQKALPEDSPLRIPFRFFLVDEGVLGTYPNGSIVVSSSIFDTVENEAQLAYVLANSIARATTNDAWRWREYKKKRDIIEGSGFAGALFTLGGSAVVGEVVARAHRTEYIQHLDAESDRVALQYMLAAGYDVREAQEFWTVVAKGLNKRLHFSNSDNSLFRRSYLSAEVNLNYPIANTSMLRKDSAEFHQTARTVAQILQSSGKRANGGL